MGSKTEASTSIDAFQHAFSTGTEDATASQLCRHPDYGEDPINYKERVLAARRASNGRAAVVLIETSTSRSRYHVELQVGALALARDDLRGVEAMISAVGEAIRALRGSFAGVRAVADLEPRARRLADWLGDLELALGQPVEALPGARGSRILFTNRHRTVLFTAALDRVSWLSRSYELRSCAVRVQRQPMVSGSTLAELGPELEAVIEALDELAPRAVDG